MSKKSRIYTLEDFDFDLPEELISQHPAKNREKSRLLVIDNQSGKIHHSGFSDIGEYLRPGDVLVFNNTRVICGRVFFKRKSGGEAEFILIKKISGLNWSAITNRTSRIKVGDKLTSVKDPSVKIIIADKTGSVFNFSSNIELTENILEQIGEVPLPPYIKRTPDKDDHVRYQTVYGNIYGSIAAPTAGLHFTNDLLRNLTESGIKKVFLTLNISWGTFQPVREKNIKNHIMHSESYVLSYENADILNLAVKDGRRIISVGTTSLRVLGSTYREGLFEGGNGETDLFIYPPHEIKFANGLLTNFHTPRSTLLMLVCSFGGYDNIMNAYSEAIKMRYRFYSYGDSMLIIK